MNQVSLLTSVLLFAFSTTIVTRYRILPIIGTPYWLFGVLFFLLFLHLILSFAPFGKRMAEGLERVKNVIFWIVLVIVLGGTTVTAIADRTQSAPVFGVHDIILQQEEAMRYLLQGKNPYKETYFGTFVEEFNYDEVGNSEAVNPALLHFVMPPWYLLFPFGFYFLSLPLLGYFDGRMPLLFLTFGLLALVACWIKKKDVGLLAITLLGLSPATVDFFLEGRSDLFALFWLVLALYLFRKGHVIWSGVVYGLALMTKQTIWFSLPFYLALVWWKTQNAKLFFVNVYATVFVAGAVVFPFLVWDAKAYLESTVLYLSGGGVNSYPIAGYGWGMVLLSLGIIKDLHAAHPFFVWQIILGVPVLFILLRFFRKNLSFSFLWFGYATFLFVVWYFSRYFNNSHLGYLSSLYVLAGCFFLDEQQKV